MQLLVVPFVLTIIGISFTLLQDTRQQQIEERRAQDLALQSYLDQMSTLVLEDLSNTKVQILLCARTLTVLERLDPTRKTEDVLFLSDAELIQREGGREPTIALHDADLRGANLRSVDLKG